MSRNPVVLDDGELLEANIKMKPVLQLATETHLFATVTFDVATYTKEEREIFRIEFEYAAVYFIDKDAAFSEEEVNQVGQTFVEKNVPINVWPFARELIADLSNRMNVPRLLIGMYRYLPTDKADEEAND